VSATASAAATAAAAPGVGIIFCSQKNKIILSE